MVWTDYRMSPDHPIFRMENNDYVRVDDLTSDDTLLSLGEGDTTNARGFLSYVVQAGSETVFNLTVSPHHNYFASGVLVHNKTVLGANCEADTTQPCDHPCGSGTQRCSSDGLLWGICACSAASPDEDAGNDIDAGS